MKKKALRKDFYMEIRKSMGRFLSIFFIVALGVSLFSGLRATEPSMRLSGDTYADENNLMDLRIASPFGITEKDIEAIRQLATISAAEGAYSVDVLCKVKDSKRVLHVMTCLEEMNTITVEEGRLPKEKNECLVDSDFLKSAGYQVGDTILLESGTEAELTNTLKDTELLIVGSGNSPCYFSNDRGSTIIGNGSVAGFLVVPKETFAMPVYTEVYAMVQGAAELNSFTDEYERLVEKAVEDIYELTPWIASQMLGNSIEDTNVSDVVMWYVFDRSSIPEYTGYGDNADRIAALSIVFPGLFFLVAALISLTTMTRMVEEQRVQIGTLKALGYTKAAIAGKYVKYALFATLGGSILGVLIGEKLFPYIIIMAYKVLYTHIPHVLVPYHWEYGVVATAIAVACTGFATLAACYKELLSQPAVLMRPAAPQSGKRTWIERIGFLWKRLNFTWKSSLRNLFRYKKRLFMTLFGIGGCMGLLLVGYGLRDSISSVSKIQYGSLQTYDASIYLGDTMDEDSRRQLETYLQQNASITQHMGTHMSHITTQKGEEEVEAYLTVISDTSVADSFFVFRDRVSKDRYVLGNQGIILSEKTAKLLNVKEGDCILISEDGVNPKEVVVDRICENYVGHYVYMTEVLYEELYEKMPFYNSLLIRSDVPMEELEKIGEDILQFSHVLNIQYTEQISNQLTDMLVALDRVMIVLIVVAGMLSFVVLYNLNNINVTERRRELATLKVLGFRDGEVAAYVYRENILLTLLGVIVGCGLGRALHLFTITTVEVDQAMFGREIFFSSYVIGALFTIGFSILVNWMMYFKLKKIDMVESLKSVE